MRAIAVMAVVLFHVGGWLPAGFVGVDIFFVISGFVVFGSCQSLDLSSLPRFLLDFYGRRLVRIMPALAVCISLTMILLVLFIPIGGGGRLTDINATTGLAALVGAGNIILARGSHDYWAPATEFNPFTHTWSLGVEEQFYLLGPLIFFAYFSGRRLVATCGLAVLAFVSICVAASWGSGAESYYLLPARFWEMAAGALLYLSMPLWRGRGHVVLNRFFSWGGLFALGGAAFLTNRAHFPWPQAITPVVGSALIIIGTINCPSDFLATLLRSGGARWLGDRSYSIYLWHWPILILARWTFGAGFFAVQILLVVLALILADASRRWVELPASRYLNILKLHHAGRLFWGAVAALAVLALLLFSLIYFRPLLSLSATSQRAIWDSRVLFPADGAPCHVQEKKSALGAGLRVDFEPLECRLRSQKVFVVGDSHAGAYLGALGTLAENEGYRIRVFTMGGCAVASLQRPFLQESKSCQAFQALAFSDIASEMEKGDVLFIPGLRISRIRDSFDESPAPREELIIDRSRLVDEAVARLRPLVNRGVRIIIEAPKPVFPAPPYRCMDWFNKMNPVCGSGFQLSLADLQVRRSGVLAAQSAMASALGNSEVIDLVPALCDAGVCSAIRNGVPLFFDGDHLSGAGNRAIYDSLKVAIEGH